MDIETVYDGSWVKGKELRRPWIFFFENPAGIKKCDLPSKICVLQVSPVSPMFHPCWLSIRQASVCWSLAAVEVRRETFQNPPRGPKWPLKTLKKNYMWKGHLSKMTSIWVGELLVCITRYLGFLENKDADGKSRNLEKKTTPLQPKGSIGIFPFGIRSLDEGLGLAITKELVAQGVRGAQFDVSKSRGWLGEISRVGP